MNAYQTKIYNQYSKFSWKPSLQQLAMSLGALMVAVMFYGVFAGIFPLWVESLASVIVILYIISHVITAFLGSFVLLACKFMLFVRSNEDKIKITIDGDPVDVTDGKAKMQMNQSIRRLFQHFLDRGVLQNKTALRIFDVITDSSLFGMMVLTNHPVMGTIFLLVVLTMNFMAFKLRKYVKQYVATLDDPLEGADENIDDLSDKLFHGKD